MASLEPNVGVAFALHVLFLAFPGAMAQEQNNGGSLTVRTDDVTYETGDTITVSGSVASVIVGGPLALSAL